MTDELPFRYGSPPPPTPNGVRPKPHRHVWGEAFEWVQYPVIDGVATLADGRKVGSDSLIVEAPEPMPGLFACSRCGKIRDAAASRRGRNSRKRGGAAELDVARTLGASKVGPLGLPHDVVMPGYARLQVRKYATPQGLRKIASELARIGSGEEMPGYVWIEPGRGGEQLIVFRLRDFAERHGVKVE